MTTCQICDVGTAKIHVTQIRQGKVLTIHLCTACAEEHGLVGPALATKMPLIEISSESEVEDAETGAVEQGASCPECGLTWRQFQESGRLGCPDCYLAFGEQLAPLLEKIHGTGQHLGKQPCTAPGPAIEPDDTLQQLRAQLQAAVELEQFDLAARLRDQIRSLAHKAS